MAEIVYAQSDPEYQAVSRGDSNIDDYINNSATEEFRLLSWNIKKLGLLCWPRFFKGDFKRYPVDNLQGLMPRRNVIYVAPCGKKVVRLFASVEFRNESDFVLFLR